MSSPPRLLALVCLCTLSASGCNDGPAVNFGSADAAPTDIGATADAAGDAEEASDTGDADSMTTGDAGADVSVDAAADAAPIGTPPDALGGERPAPYYVPDGYDPAEPMPVLVLLHGYTSSGSGTAQWWQMVGAADEAGVLLVVPEGTVDAGGAPFWNGTDFCCDFYESGVDDVGYVTGLIDEAAGWFNIDPAKVWLIGHSNGGFMSHRIACERSDLVTAIVNVAGATYSDPADCGDPSAVSLLQIHGTWDTAIFYGGIEPNVGDPDAEPLQFADCMEDVCPTEWDACLDDTSCGEMLACFGGCAGDDTCNSACFDAGTQTAQFLWMEGFTCGASGGCFGDPRETYAGYASTQEGLERWAATNGCGDTATDGEAFDLLRELPGNDTYPRSFDDCPEGLAADLWSMRYGSHSPGFNDNFAIAVLDWLAAQNRP